jgi:hypothetical protein
MWWLYDAAAETFTLTCISKPWYVSESMIQGKLADLIAKAKATSI